MNAMGTPCDDRNSVTQGVSVAHDTPGERDVMSTTTTTVDGATPDTEAVMATTTAPKSDLPADLTLEDAWKLIQNQRIVERDAKRRADKAETELDTRKKTEADAEAQRLKDDQKWEQYGKAQEDRATAAEATLAAERLASRDRLAQAEVKAVAARLRFHKPEIAYRLIDTSKLEFDEDGAPANAETLLTALATSDPYLIASEDDGKRGIPGTPRGQAMNRDQLIEQEIQAQRAGRSPIR